MRKNKSNNIPPLPKNLHECPKVSPQPMTLTVGDEFRAYINGVYFGTIASFSYKTLTLKRKCDDKSTDGVSIIIDHNSWLVFLLLIWRWMQMYFSRPTGTKHERWKK